MENVVSYYVIVLGLDQISRKDSPENKQNNLGPSDIEGPLNLYLIFVILVFPILFLEVTHTEVNIVECQDNVRVKSKTN